MSTLTGEITLLAATTSATNSKSFRLSATGGRKKKVKIQVSGLAGSEKAYIQEKKASAGTFSDYKFNGQVPYFDADGETILMDEVGEFRVRKDASVGAVAVMLIADQEVVVSD
jgi:hypothetical protein